MNMKNTEQVSEVQGLREEFEAWAKSAGLEPKIYAHNDMYSHPVTRGAWIAWKCLAARQSGAREPVAWQVNATRTNRGWESCTRECYDDTLRTGRYMGLPAGTKDVEVRALYEATPAQGIDLGQLQDAKRYRQLRRRMCIAGGEFHIINLRPTYVAPNAASELDAVLDSTMDEARDAAPGVE